jgi:nicotinate-nucleotide adenylyltransferase
MADNKKMRRDFRKMKIGLMGGTFNPVHLAHLVAARDALELFRLDQVWFIPCARPPHKGHGALAPAADRLAMLKRAIRDEPWASVCDMELRRGGLSYTVDTLRELKALHPGARFHFIMGTDSLAELHQWRDIDTLLTLCPFVSIGRPGWSPAALEREGIRLPPPWPERLMARVRTGHMIGISSTEIRKRASRGLSLRYLVPDAVASYIEKKALYRARENA